MATTIRLKRIGKKKQSFYRITVADSSSPRDGKVIEEIGFYDPNQNPAKVDIEKERLEYWLGNGAVLTPTVENLLKIRPADTAKKTAKKTTKK
jgi:small subunit ribosomal protein S16